tara:strand:- start:752 stop:1498 length:747 start_codon:yes stop_codon:yes gene_type:complete
MVFIYILKLEQNKYYVGKTNNPTFRMDDHFSGGCGSSPWWPVWTQKYAPIKILEVIPNCDDYDEDKYVKIYMKKYGIDNVRGGSYSQIKLIAEQFTIIERELISSMDECFRCGLRGHFIKDCKTPLDVCEQIAKYKKKIVKKEGKHADVYKYSNVLMKLTGMKAVKLDSLEEKIDKFKDKLQELEIKYSLCGKTEKNVENKIYLNVSYKDKDYAKRLFALWDSNAKCWYTMADNENNDELLKLYRKTS